MPLRKSRPSQRPVIALAITGGSEGPATDDEQVPPGEIPRRRASDRPTESAEASATPDSISAWPA